MDYAELNLNVKYLVSQGHTFSDALDIVWSFYKPFDDEDYIGDEEEIVMSSPIEVYTDLSAMELASKMDNIEPLTYLLPSEPHYAMELASKMGNIEPATYHTGLYYDQEDDIDLNECSDKEENEIPRSMPEKKTVRVQLVNDEESESDLSPTISSVRRQKKKRVPKPVNNENAVKVQIVNDEENERDLSPTISSVRRQKMKKAIRVRIVDDIENENHLVPSISSVPRQKRKFYSVNRHLDMLDFQDDMADARELISIFTRKAESDKRKMRKIEVGNRYRNKKQ